MLRNYNGLKVMVGSVPNETSPVPRPGGRRSSVEMRSAHGLSVPPRGWTFQAKVAVARLTHDLSPALVKFVVFWLEMMTHADLRCTQQWFASLWRASI